MRLTIFESDLGDCLLLESGDGQNRVLIDGGMSKSMRQFVAPTLGKLREDGKALDYVYVSHIDADHISGVLQMLQTEVDWRVFEHQKSIGNKKARKPATARPPQIGGLWHNAFPAQLGAAGPVIVQAVAEAAPTLLATRVGGLTDVGEDLYGIAASTGQALQVSRLVAPEMLGIPLNAPPTAATPGGLMKVGAVPKFQVGSMDFTIVGPTDAELDLLRKGWEEWVRQGGDEIRDIEERLRKQREQFAASSGEPPPVALFTFFGVKDYKGITIPNIASLMFLVEEGGKRILLTGDSHHDMILGGLKKQKLLKDGEGLHLNVLKVQHHGAAGNIDADFLRRVSADDYVFCGNGAHNNPELSVLQQVYDSRLGKPALRTLAPDAADRPFRFWFSTSPGGPTGDAKAKAQMVKVKALVDKLVAQSGGRLTARFNAGDSIAFDI